MTRVVTPAMDQKTEYVKELGKLRYLRVEKEDHGILILSFQLDFGGAVQGGHVILDAWDQAKNRRVGTARGMDMVLRTMEALKVDSLEAAKNRTVYALYRAPMRHNDIIRGLEVPAFDGGGRILFDETPG